MAFSTCSKCNGHTFERALLTPLREQNKVAVLQCAECGTLIGVLDSPSTIQIENLQKQIAAIDAGLNRIAKALAKSMGTGTPIIGPAIGELSSIY